MIDLIKYIIITMTNSFVIVYYSNKDGYVTFIKPRVFQFRS